MKRLANQLLLDETGVVITAEIIIIATVGLLSLIAGWNAVSNALAFELGDIANSVGSLDQSFQYRGLSAGAHANCSGGGFADSAQTFTVNTVDVSVTGPGANGEIEIIIPRIQAAANAQAAGAQAATAEEAVAVFGVERIEQLNAVAAANAVAVGNQAEALDNQAAGAAKAATADECEVELKTLLNEIQKLCIKAEELKKRNADK
ncbi:MAG: hypothetical protein O2820_25215 [Planctomycetota bacterium]|nr:hypothetical protein [Planctomycetota bacterium]MDA1252515.1 hypothetical protein [Planctomycetota bacterium]